MGIFEFKHEISTYYMGPQYGLVTVSRNGDEFHSIGMGNGVMNTGLYYLILAQHGVKEPAPFERTMKACEASSSGFPIPALIKRHPLKPEHQSHDDYIGFMAACAYLDEMRAMEVVRYGKKFSFVYDVERPFTNLLLDKSHDRFPGLVAYYKMCSNETISIWELAVFCLRLSWMIITLNSDGDTPIHSYCFASVFKYRYPILGRFFFSMWVNQAKRKFGSIAKAFAPYYGESHPFAKMDYDP